MSPQDGKLDVVYTYNAGVETVPWHLRYNEGLLHRKQYDSHTVDDQWPRKPAILVPFNWLRPTSPWNEIGPLKVCFPVPLSIGHHSMNQMEQFPLICELYYKHWQQSLDSHFTLKMDRLNLRNNTGNTAYFYMMPPLKSSIARHVKLI